MNSNTSRVVVLLSATIIILLMNAYLIDAKCNDAEKQAAEACARRVMLVGHRGYKSPTTDEEAVADCEQRLSDIKCIREHARSCFTPFSRQLITSMIPAMTRAVKASCRSAPKRAEYIAESHCTSPQDFQRAHHCMDVASAKLNLIYTSSEVKQSDRIPGACCLYQDLMKCIPSVEPPKDKVACPAKLDFTDMLTSSVGDMLDLVCGGYETPGECKVNAPRVEKLFSQLESDSSKLYLQTDSRSLLFQLVDLFSGTSITRR